MRRQVLTTITGLALASLIAPSATFAHDEPAYLPEEGDDVVLYTHTFRPENYDEASSIVVDEFTAAMDEQGQERYTLWLRNPSTYQLLAVSVFAPDSEVDDWHAYSGRLDVLGELAPMRQAPMVVERFQLYSVTSTDASKGEGTVQGTPAYLPQAGDDVTVYTHTFRPEVFQEASEITAGRFDSGADKVGAQRYSLKIENPSTYQVVSITDWAPGTDIDAWHASPDRLAVLETLEPLRQEPMVVERWEVYAVTSTDGEPGQG
jgi:hypothetical protein